MKQTRKIDFSDIPELKLADFRRVRRATLKEVEEGRKTIEAKLGTERPMTTDGSRFISSIKKVAIVPIVKDSIRKYRGSSRGGSC